MKTTRYLSVALLMLMSVSLSARTYVQGEKIYVNVNQSFDWSVDEARLFLYFWQSWDNANQWMSLTQCEGSIYEGTWTADIPFDRVIVVRKNNDGTVGNWDNRWNQTCSIEIPDNDADVNLLNTFSSKEHPEDADCATPLSQEWKNYTPPVSKISSFTSSLTPDVIQYCAAAVGDPFSLKAKLKADRSDYDYANVKGHGWYKSTNGTTWTSIDSYAGTMRDGEGGINIQHTIESGVIYYYLHSNIPAGRRLIKMVQLTSGCELDCTITSFETAISAVNADDNTYTLDGVVAFGEPSGNLVIECDGQSISIPSPHSPQSFSLPGVPAATTDGQTTTARAHFTGNDACTKEITIAVPNATQALNTVTKNILTGTVTTLTPDGADPDNDYVWIVNGVEYKKADGQAQSFTVNAFDKDTAATYTYKEYYPISGTMDDMMANGGYEDADASIYGTMGTTSLISDYTFWNRYDNASTYVNFYDNDAINPWVHTSATDSVRKYVNNGFAVVRSAYNFFHTYASVLPREGNYFALFDAATGAAGGNKKAWYATTANNPDLKLKAGTTYVLSFWAANVNNYGEMDNAARFKFRIEYNGHTWESGVLDLSSDEYRNNIWHQHSETFFAVENCDDVTISVVNLNTNTLNIGNDFALDDIQFHAISSVSRVVKSQQKFTVHAHEPKVDVFTATVQPLACEGGPSYGIRMHVEYQNPNSGLVIKDLTTGTEYPLSAPATAYDTSFSKDTTITLASRTPEFHSWKVYFADWTTAEKETETQAPAVPELFEPAAYTFSTPDCADITTTLTFDLTYVYQQGTCTYWVDNLPPVTAAFTPQSRDTLTLTDLAFSNIPADGLNNHVLHVRFDGVNSCEKTYTLPAVPFSYKIDTVEITSAIPDTVLCTIDSYEVSVKATTHYDATGKNILFSYDDNGAATTTVVVDGNVAVATLTLHNIDDETLQVIAAAYEDSPACSVNAATSFVAPHRATCNRWTDTICAGDSYHEHGLTIGPLTTGEYAYQIGFNDSLWLTVTAVPQVTIGTIEKTCDDQGDIRFPFTVVDGTPDLFTVTIGEKTYTTTVDNQEIVLPLTTEWTAGDYQALIAVATEGTTCSSETQVSFTIAASRQMLRKWDDVLFISNKDQRYVAYQWFENGSELLGATEQSLYNPDGLNGAYYCRMTTTEGKTVYTCEQDFDDVTRSRDIAPAEAPQRTLVLYDMMGHELDRLVTTDVQATLHPATSGIYILSIRTATETKVMKLQVR